MVKNWGYVSFLSTKFGDYGSVAADWMTSRGWRAESDDTGRISVDRGLLTEGLKGDGERIENQASLADKE